MKIRIEGCTREEISEDHGGEAYLTVGKEYEAKVLGPDWWSIRDDENQQISVLGPKYGCAHIPEKAKWVEVTE